MLPVPVKSDQITATQQRFSFIKVMTNIVAYLVMNIQYCNKILQICHRAFRGCNNQESAQAQTGPAGVLRCHSLPRILCGAMREL